MMTELNSNIAVFDFDGTLTTKDTLLPFLSWTHDLKDLMLGSVKQGPAIVSYLTGNCSNHWIKEKLLTQFYKGWPVEKFRTVATEYAHGILPTLIDPEALERLKWHQLQGHSVIILSAALYPYLSSWAKTVQVGHVLATRVEMQQGRITGKLKGKSCYGVEKVNQLKLLLGSLGDYYIYAYGDSKGDREMLAIADEPYYRKFGNRRQLIIH